MTSKPEMFAIASLHLRNSVAFAANSSLAKEFLNTPLSKRTGAKALANAAMINALKGGTDYSNGANQWDGAELAMVSKANMDEPSDGSFMYKMNTVGWSIWTGALLSIWNYT